MHRRPGDDDSSTPAAHNRDMSFAHTSETIVEFDRVSKCFGEVLAVDDLTFRVTRSELCGLLVPNGAGKTTTLRMIAGMQRTTRGAARLFGGHVVPSMPELARVGTMIDQAAFVPTVSGRENLRWWGCATG